MSVVYWRSRAILTFSSLRVLAALAAGSTGIWVAMMAVEGVEVTTAGTYLSDQVWYCVGKGEIFKNQLYFVFCHRPPFRGENDSDLCVMQPCLLDRGARLQIICFCSGLLCVDQEVDLCRRSCPNFMIQVLLNPSMNELSNGPSKQLIEPCPLL